MPLSSHLQELKNKHRTLDAQVEEARKSPATDDLELQEMKKRKLFLKDRMTRLSQN